jgi:hypothetical protein
MSTKGLGFVIVGPRGGVVRGVKYGPNTLVWSPWPNGLDGKPHAPCRTATTEELKLWRRLARLEKTKR